MLDRRLLRVPSNCSPLWLAEGLGWSFWISKSNRYRPRWMEKHRHRKKTLNTFLPLSKLSSTLFRTKLPLLVSFQIHFTRSEPINQRRIVRWLECKSFSSQLMITKITYACAQKTNATLSSTRQTTFLVNLLFPWLFQSQTREINWLSSYFGPHKESSSLDMILVSPSYHSGHSWSSPSSAFGYWPFKGSSVSATRGSRPFKWLAINHKVVHWYKTSTWLQKEELPLATHPFIHTQHDHHRRHHQSDNQPCQCLTKNMPRTPTCSDTFRWCLLSKVSIRKSAFEVKQVKLLWN